MRILHKTTEHSSLGEFAVEEKMLHSELQTFHWDVIG